jgi:hypothetical protein
MLFDATIIQQQYVGSHVESVTKSHRDSERSQRQRKGRSGSSIQAAGSGTEELRQSRCEKGNKELIGSSRRGSDNGASKWCRVSRSRETRI